MMGLCKTGHRQVCYQDDTDCPVCKMREDMQEEIDDLENQIASLEAQIDQKEE